MNITTILINIGRSTRQLEHKRFFPHTLGVQYVMLLGNILVLSHTRHRAIGEVNPLNETSFQGAEERPHAFSTPQDESPGRHSQ
jgi:hypothetical protein